jgi:hypothetical protein
MLVKGAVMKPTLEFVRKNHPATYPTWYGMLSEECREILETGSVTSWYPLRLAMVEPTEVLCQLLPDRGDEVAWDLGRFSADFALSGIFRIFVRLGSPGFIVKRASRVFSTYYSSAVLRIPDSGPNHAVAQILEFPEPHRLVERRIAGWMERAVELSGSSGVKSEIVSSMADGDPIS